MRWTARSRRVAVIVCLAIPAMVIVASGRSQAQPKFQPQQPKMPPIQQPKMPQIPQMQFQNEWRCTRCNAFLGNGAAPVAKCPGCGATIINGVGGPNNAPPPPGINPPPAGVQDVNVNVQPGRGGSDSRAALICVIVGGVVVLVLAAGAGVGIYFAVASDGKNKRGSRRKRPRRRRDAEDEEDDE